MLLRLMLKLASVHDAAKAFLLHHPSLTLLVLAACLFALAALVERLTTPRVNSGVQENSGNAAATANNSAAAAAPAAPGNLDRVVNSPLSSCEETAG